MIESKSIRRAFACAAVLGCGSIIALRGEALAQSWTMPTAGPAASKAEPASDAERAALRRLVLKYVALKDLKGAKRAAVQKAYDAEKETFLKSYDPAYLRDKSAYQAVADEYEAKRKAVWQGALDELKAQGYEFSGTKLEGEDLQYRKRPVEDDLAEASAPAQNEPRDGYLAIVNKYVQSNAEVQDLGARRLQAYKTLVAHQDALIEKIDAEVLAASQEAAKPATAKTAPLEAPKPPAEALAKPSPVEPTQPLVEAPAKPAAEATAKPSTLEAAKPAIAGPVKSPAEEGAPPPRPPELRMGEEHMAPAASQTASAAPVAPPTAQTETPLPEAGKKVSASALPPLPALPKDDGLPEAPSLPDDEQTASIPAPVAAPLPAAPLPVPASQGPQLRIGLFGSASFAQPSLFWAGPGGGALAPFAVSPSLNQTLGGGGAQLALRLRPLDALPGLSLGLAADVSGRAGRAQSGFFPFVSTRFSSGLQATQRLEIAYDFDLGGTTVVTPFATAGFSEAQFAVSRYGAALGAFAWGNASNFKLGATYGGGLEVKVFGPATLQLLYLRHEYNPTNAAIWGGGVGGAVFGARKGLVENELRVGVVIPVPDLW